MLRNAFHTPLCLQMEGGTTALVVWPPSTPDREWANGQRNLWSPRRSGAPKRNKRNLIINALFNLWKKRLLTLDLVELIKSRRRKCREHSLNIEVALQLFLVLSLVLSLLE